MNEDPEFKDKSKVYVVIGNLILKFLFGIAIIVGFFIILGHLLSSEPEWAKTVPYSVLEGILARTMYQATKHYFPSEKNK